jgi:hypothetical protein
MHGGYTNTIVLTKIAIKQMSKAALGAEAAVNTPTAIDLYKEYKK